MDPSETQRLFKKIFVDLTAPDVAQYQSRWANLPNDIAAVIRKMSESHAHEAAILANRALEQHINVIYKELDKEIDELDPRGFTHSSLVEVRQIVQRIEGKLAFAAASRQGLPIGVMARPW